MNFPALTEAQAELDAKRQTLAQIFAEAGPEMDLGKVKSLSGDSHEKAAQIRALNDELTELGKKVDDLKAVAAAAEQARQAPAGEGPGEPGVEPGGGRKGREAEFKSLGDLFVESAAYRERKGSTGPEARLDIELKAVFDTATGWPPETTRTGRLVEFATRPIQVVDLIPQTTTSQAAVVYMEETTFNNTAAEVAEGGTYPEAALGLTEKTSPVRKIAVWLPVTDEQLEDEPQARSYVNNRLPFMIRQRLDSQILNGDGTAPNLRGILQTVGIQTQPKGTDVVPDAVYKAIVNVEVTGQAMANAVIFHPTDWQQVRLMRTTDGIYIWGNPSEAGPERIWGLPVVRAQAIPTGTALVGDFANFVQLAVRRGIDVQVSSSHADFFVNGKQAIRADMRVALVVYRPAAFCSVTGLSGA